MSEGEKKQRSSLLLAIILIVVFCCAMIAFLLLKQYGEKKLTENSAVTDASSLSTSFDEKELPETNENSNSPNSNINSTTNTDNSNQPSNIDPAKTANDYYDVGLGQIAQKQYLNAVANFNEAIKLNPKEPEYYSKKAEAQVALGKKQDAIETVQEGLKEIPGNTTLQNKLNILQSVVR